MALDVSDDYTIFDGVEDVTVTLRRTTGDTARSVSDALMRSVAGSDSQAAGVVIGADTTSWTIPVDELESGDVIQEGDTITDAASVVWTIKSVTHATLESRWRCVCVKQR